jgi:hypothetical protein
MDDFSDSSRRRMRGGGNEAWMEKRWIQGFDAEALGRETIWKNLV